MTRGRCLLLVGLLVAKGASSSKGSVVHSASAQLGVLDVFGLTTRDTLFYMRPVREARPQGPTIDAVGRYGDGFFGLPTGLFGEERMDET